MSEQVELLTKNAITLKGSAELVREYLHYGINSVLYQRGVYPPESFTTTEYHGITMLITTNDKIKIFLNNVLGQIEDWLVKKKMEKISLIIANVDNGEPLERWDFNVQYEEGTTENGEAVGKKDLKIIQKEIRDVLRQISATISFLPLLDHVCSFDVLVYTKSDCEVPKEWDETKPRDIINPQEVQLRSFSTSLHRMETFVSYKVE